MKNKKQIYAAFLLFLISFHPAFSQDSEPYIDLERYGNGADMSVDYVRVYAEKPLDYKVPAEAIKKHREGK